MLPEGDKDATELESSTDETADDDGSSQDEGQKSKKSTDQLLKEFKLENQRKADENKRLKSQLEDFKSEKEERLQELEAKSKLTRSEKEEMVSLEQSIADIERDQKAKPWLEVNRRQSEKTVSEILSKRDFDDAMDMVEEWAESEGLGKKEFENSLMPHLRNHRGEERYTKRVKLAYKDFVQKKKDSEELAELRKAKIGDTGVRREISQSYSKPLSKKELMGDAIKNKNFIELLKGVEAVQTHDRQSTTRQD